MSELQAMTLTNLKPTNVHKTEFELESAISNNKPKHNEGYKELWGLWPTGQWRNNVKIPHNLTIFYR